MSKRKRQTRAELRQRTEGFLHALGFGLGSWSWDGADLNVIVNGEIRSLKLAVSKTSLARWMFAMGQIKGWADVAGISAPAPAKHLNGSAAHTGQLELHA